MVEKGQGSLKEIVGDKVYSVWVDMLHRLVPDGRTHRLAPTIASMLQYTSEVAHKKYGSKPKKGSIADFLYIAQEEDDRAVELLSPLVEQLLQDSLVKSKRKSAKGVGYSIAETAIQEFINWYNMPWES